MRDFRLGFCSFSLKTVSVRFEFFKICKMVLLRGDDVVNYRQNDTPHSLSRVFSRTIQKCIYFLNLTFENSDNHDTVSRGIGGKLDFSAPSRGKKTTIKFCLTYAGPMCYLLHKLPFPSLPTLLPCHRAHCIKISKP